MFTLHVKDMVTPYDTELLKETFTKPVLTYTMSIKHFKVSRQAVKVMSELYYVSSLVQCIMHVESDNLL